MKRRIEVSHEMLTFVGPGAMDASGWPDDPVTLRFPDLTPARAMVEVLTDPAVRGDDVAEARLVLVVASAAIRRLFGKVPSGRWHLPGELVRLARAIVDGRADAAGEVLQLARSIELLCGIVAALENGALVAADADGALSAGDTRRIAAARRLIDERWREPLSLDGVARACGVNRAKLTRGFRQLFHCSVGDAITDRRLSGARDMLLATDLPVASVGYACGYRNNASFTRAFTRRYGLAPTLLRQHAA